MSLSLISLLLIASVISYFMEQQVYDQRKQLLEQKAIYVNNLFFQLKDDLITSDYFIQALNIMQANDGVGVSVILDEERKMGIKSIGRKPVNLDSSTINSQEHRGEYFIAYFESESEGNDVQMLTVSIPLKVNDIWVGEVFIYSPVANMKLIVGQVNRLIFLTFLFTSIPVSFLLYIISKKFTKPLIDMNEVASNIAKGDFSQNAIINGRDEISQLGKSLNHMALQIENLEELRKDLIANASHELKTPLTTIQNFIQGILDGVIEPNESEAYLNIALDETKRLGNLVAELIELSSFEKKIAVLDKSSTNITQLVNEIILQMGFHFQKKNIKIYSEKQDNIIACVDQERFRQVIINVLDNAIRYTPDNGQIIISLSQETDQGFVLKIRDNGYGIQEKDLPYIFERFFKGDRSRQKTSGFGLGLTISKHIIEAHDGTITIAKTEPSGTEVVIKINTIEMRYS